MPTAYSYKRFSTPEQSKGDSLRRQTEAVHKFIEAHPELELELSEEVFDDLGKSGFKGDHLKAEGQLRRFRRLVEDGVITAGSWLLVENFDRLSRGDALTSLPLLMEIIQQDITVCTLANGRWYSKAELSGHEGFFKLMEPLFIMSRAHEESVTKAMRVSKAWESKRERLKSDSSESYTKQIPFWLTDKDSPDAKKVELVRHIYEAFRAGTGAAGIAAKLNTEGIPAPKGGRWNASTIKRLLDSPAVLGGLKTVQGTIENVFPHVLDETLVAAVRQIRSSTVKGRKAPDKEVHPFAGLLKCSACGANVTRVVKSAKKNWTYLVCSNAKVRHHCQYVAWPYKDALMLLADNFDLFEHNSNTVYNVDEVQARDAELDELVEATRDAFELWQENKKSPFLKEAFQKAEQQFQEASKAYKALLAANERPARQATYEALAEMRDNPSNTVLRTLISSGVANLKERTMTLKLHGGTTIELQHLDYSLETV
jgi:DNA invertase Pin-like site-specific DNA recombinase